MEVLSDPAGKLETSIKEINSSFSLAGSPEDKLRLFLIHYICSPTMTQVK
jgi:hypothetical protein